MDTLGAAFHRVQELEAQGQRDPQSLKQLIQGYEQIVGQLQPDENPLLYAAIQANLGLAYYELPTGDRGAHLQRAIACYREALRFQTPETAPLDYAMTQNNLGTAYYELPTGDRAANLERAIACYQETLRFWTPESAPLDYAMTQYNLGNAYSDLASDNYPVSLERAIACYREALRFWTPETAPLDYASTQHNLGNAYSDLPIGDRTANLVQAITCYQEALRFRTPEAEPLDYASSQHNLGFAYYELSAGDRAANLTQAITCYREALRFWTPETAPFDYALTQHNLGNAYKELPTGDRSIHLERAIACYREALRFWTPEAAPLDYARTEHNLGTAYYEQLAGDRAANLERAIACYQQALRFRTAETALLDYASTQNSLGMAYSDLPKGDRTAHLKRAIACYQEALRFRTPKAVPLDYARTQHNLGATYTSLPTGDRAANLTQAITCYREALLFRTPEAAPLDYARTQHNLGMAYSSLPPGNRAAQLAQAITCYQEALRFLTPAIAPLDYALIQNSLGNAYSDLSMGDRVANLERAIACFQEALRFRTPEIAPLDYASTQNNLGLAYSTLPAGDRAANVVRAIACFQEALRFWALEIAPAECRMVNRNLAKLHFAQGAWQAALEAYRSAMEAGERLYRAGLSAESKATEVAENAALYRHAAFSAVRCGQTTDALLILERGKTRLLAEALRWRIPRPVNVPDEVWAAFEQAGAVVRATQSEETIKPGQVVDPIQAYKAREQAAQTAHAALDAAIEQVRLSTPDFLRPFDFSGMQASLPDERTALVAFCITDRGSLSFVVSHVSDQEVQVVEIPTFTRTELHRLLAEFDAGGRPMGGWLDAYDHYRMEPTPAAFATWQETITHTLAEVGQHLLAPVLSTLPPGTERITFLPSAELFLLPLHAAPLSESSPDRVCDRYEVSYAPSLEVLASIRGKAAQAATPELYAVINPEDDPRLVFTLTEGAAVAKLFPKCSVDEGRAGTKQHLLAAVQGRTYVHFACHGSYDWDDPLVSGLDLADGRLTLAELQNGVVDLTAARLVTLSACETGVSDVMKGSAEEYVGIPAGFFLAGVPCVVSSLWVVPDLSTALLMERLYHNHLQEKMDLAAALREAQIWVRELTIGEVAQYVEHWYQHAHGREKTELYRLMRYYRHQAEQNPLLHPFAHPYYWAAFTVNGI